MKEGLTFVVLLGYNQLADNFEEVVLGKPEQRLLGRGAMALWACLRFQADYLLFTTGVVENDKSESIAEKDFLLGHTRVIEPMLAYRTGIYENFAGYIATGLCDLESKDTMGNLKWVKGVVESKTAEFNNNNIKHTIVLVSDPAHLSRVLLNASRVFGTEYTTIGVQSDIPYAGELGDGMALEPPLLEHIRPELMDLIKKGVQKMNEAKNNPAKIKSG